MKVVCADCGAEHQQPDDELVASEYRSATYEFVEPEYRCATCAYAAEDAAAKRRSKRGFAVIGFGALLFGVSATMWITKSDIEDPHWYEGEGLGSLFMYVLMTSIACVAIGLSMIRVRIRKLKE